MSTLNLPYSMQKNRFFPAFLKRLSNLWYAVYFPPQYPVNSLS